MAYHLQRARRPAAQDQSGAVSASTLKRAASGHTLPQEHVVTAYARACGATTEEEREALRLRRAARAEERGVLADLRAPAVRSIRTPADFDAALAAAYERAGAPPRRILQERATTDEEDGALLLPLTTLWRITRREARPATWEQCAAFLRGCGIHPRRMGPWQEAWQRIHTTTPPEQSTAPAAGRRTGAARPGIVRPLADGSWWQQWESSMDEGYRLAVMDPYERMAAEAVAGRFYAEAHPVAAAAFNDFVTALGRTARRNGTAPDTGIDAIAVRNGKLFLLQSKHAGGTAAPPTGEGATAPGLPPRPSGPSDLARHATSA
nr:hypothetical protein [Streptomyces sp. S1D4-11]QIZ01296.1 hypothetical protein HEP87_56355 [Streptomyces sp. S1D4-11]